MTDRPLTNAPQVTPTQRPVTTDPMIATDCVNYRAAWNADVV